jgi:hypothetical protein
MAAKRTNKKRPGIRIFEIIARAMDVKLTLTVDKAVIERAKVYARKTGRSLSDLVEQYLDAVAKEDSNQLLSPRLKKFVGTVHLPEDFNEDEIRRTDLERKHL